MKRVADLFILNLFDEERHFFFFLDFDKLDLFAYVSGGSI